MLHFYMLKRSLNFSKIEVNLWHIFLCLPVLFPDFKAFFSQFRESFKHTGCRFIYNSHMKTCSCSKLPKEFFFLLDMGLILYQFKLLIELKITVVVLLEPPFIYANWC